MNITVWATEEQKKELLQKEISSDVRFNFAASFDALKNDKIADAFFILNETSELLATEKPVLFNSVIITLKEANAPHNFHRINGWTTFLNRSVWEAATNNKEQLDLLFTKLNWSFLQTEDTPGFIAARVIAMIINEAYFALDENISTKEEIDIAMKSGTNYPFGPFEWCEIIGVKKIYELLKKLKENDSRYTPSNALNITAETV